MLNKMKQFSFSRLWAVMRHDFFSHYSRILTLLGGITLGLYALEMAQYSGSVAGIPFPESRLSVIASSLLMAMLFMSYICIGSAFAGLSTKQARISLFMLPATSAEKYVARVVGGLLLSTAGILLSALVADVLRQLSSLVLGGDSSSLLPYYIYILKDACSLSGSTPSGYVSSLWVLTALFMAFVGRYSFYLLGGVYFRKRAFMKTFGIEVLAFLLLGPSLLNFLSWHSYARATIFDTSSGCLLFSLLMLVVTVFNTVAAYYLFAHKQVIPRRRRLFFLQK